MPIRQTRILKNLLRNYLVSKLWPNLSYSEESKSVVLQTLDEINRRKACIPVPIDYKYGQKDSWGRFTRKLSSQDYKAKLTKAYKFSELVDRLVENQKKSVTL